MRVSCIVCVVLAASVAHADDVERARQLYDDGVARYDAGDYAEAIRAWQASYVMSPAPLLLFNIGQAYRLSGDCVHALENYARYASAVLSADNRDELDRATAACRDKVGKPTPVVRVQPTRRPPPIAKAASPRHTGRIVGLALGGGGIVLGGLATHFALDGRSLSRQEQSMTTWGAADITRQSRGQLDNALAWTFAGAGLVAVGVGVALVVKSGSSERAIAVGPAPGGAALAVTGRF